MIHKAWRTCGSCDVLRGVRTFPRWEGLPYQCRYNRPAPCPRPPSLVIVEHMQAVIIVPTLLLLVSVVTLVAVCIMRYCPQRKRTPGYHRSTHRPRTSPRRQLQGVDGESTESSQD